MEHRYWSFFLLLKFYGFSPTKCSYSYFYSTLLLVISLLNLLISLTYYSYPKISEYFNFIELSSLWLFYLLIVEHIVHVSSSLKNCELRKNILLSFEQFDYLIYKEFGYRTNFITKKSSMYKKLFTTYAFTVVITFLTVLDKAKSTSSFDVYWWKTLIGRVSSYIKCLQITFFVELLRQRLDTIDDILQRLQNLETKKNHLLVLKSLHFKLYEILGSINECFGCDLVFIVLQFFSLFIINNYWIFLTFTRMNNPKLALSKLT